MGPEKSYNHSMIEIDPLDLLRNANKGDRAAYEKLLLWLESHCKVQLKKGLSRYYSFPQQAFDDITQEVLISFHETHQTFDETRPLLPWVNTIIRHKMIDFIRRKDFIVVMTGTDIEVLKGEWLLEEEEDDKSQDLLALIERLPADQVDILKLAKIEGYSSKEIAKELNLSDSNVKVIIHRAVKMLKKLSS
jgi:RNA polymerase sigma-70 factor (ECF subfamily)